MSARALITVSAGSRPTHIALTRQFEAYDLVEHDLAADVRDADGIAVGADAADGAGEVIVGSAEPQAVEQRDRPCAHRDDVAEDAADARRGALERLDRRGVVVALGLEGDGEPVTEVEHARRSRPAPAARAGPRSAAA